MTSQVRWLGASDDVAATVDLAHGVYSKCKQKPTKDKQNREVLQECMGASIGTAADVVCAVYGVPPGVCSSVAGPIASYVTGALWDAGVWLGLSNAEEEAKLHADQAAKWNAWQVAEKAAIQAHTSAEAILVLAVNSLISASGKVGRTVTANDVLARLRIFGLELACFTPNQSATPAKWGGTGDALKPPPKCESYGVPNFYWDVCLASVAVNPESSSVDTAKVQSEAWKFPCKVAVQAYQLWLGRLTVAVEKYTIDLAISKARAASTKPPKKSSLPTVLALGAAAALVWWLLPSVLLKNPRHRKGPVR